MNSIAHLSVWHEITSLALNVITCQEVVKPRILVTNVIGAVRPLRPFPAHDVTFTTLLLPSALRSLPSFIDRPDNPCGMSVNHMSCPVMFKYQMQRNFAACYCAKSCLNSYNRTSGKELLNLVEQNTAI